MARVENIYPNDRRELDEIAIAVEQITGISPEQIKGRSRLKEIANARFMFCLVAYNVKAKWHNGKMITLAGYINRDHSSITHAVTEATNRQNHDDQFNWDYNQVIKILGMNNNESYIVRKLKMQIHVLSNEVKRKDQIITDLHKALTRMRRKMKPKQGLPLFG